MVGPSRASLSWGQAWRIVGSQVWKALPSCDRGAVLRQAAGFAQSQGQGRAAKRTLSGRGRRCASTARPLCLYLCANRSASMPLGEAERAIGTGARILPTRSAGDGFKGGISLEPRPWPISTTLRRLLARIAAPDLAALEAERVPRSASRGGHPAAEDAWRHDAGAEAGRKGRGSTPCARRSPRRSRRARRRWRRRRWSGGWRPRGST